MTKARHTSWPSWLVTAGVASAVIFILILYLVVAPTLLAVQYKSGAERAYSTIAKELDEATATFGQEVFLRNRLVDLPDNATPDQERQAVGADKAELTKAREAVAEARRVLDEQGDELTGYTGLPLAIAGSKAKEAEDTAERYVSRVRTYLNDYEQTVAYAERSNDISAQLVEVINALEANQSQDIAGIANGIDDATTKVNASVTEFKKLSPPEYLKADHQRDVKSADEAVSMLRELAGAVRNLDLAKLESIGARIETTAAAEEAADKEFFRRLQSDSPIKRAIEEIAPLQQDLGENIRAI